MNSFSRIFSEAILSEQKPLPFSTETEKNTNYIHGYFFNGPILEKQKIVATFSRVVFFSKTTSYELLCTAAHMWKPIFIKNKTFFSRENCQLPPQNLRLLVKSQRIFPSYSHFLSIVIQAVTTTISFKKGILSQKEHFFLHKMQSTARGF